MFGFKVICWALLFIFELRFPPGVSIATDSNLTSPPQHMDFSDSTGFILRKFRTAHIRDVTKNHVFDSGGYLTGGQWIFIYNIFNDRLLST